ncbi:ATP-binding mismatch repair protein [Stygiomarasmius scandens]|uniref:ATP-binding mismatch repair protein n=1 Tax=Marasmiellus scandens TaxID=2682957 RepID=A0ABR1IPU3_9AGAR
MRPPAQAPSVSNSSVLSRSVSLGSRPRRKDSLASVPDVDEEGEVEEGLLGFKPASKVVRQMEDDDDVDAMDVDTDNSTVAAGTSTGASARHISSPTVPSSIAPSSTPPLSKALVEALDNAKRADKEKEKDKPKSSVVLSTSKASWSHIQASSSAASVGPATQSVGNDGANKEVPGPSPDDDDEEEEPPRKRQKSAPSLDKCPAVNDDEEDDDEDEPAIPSVSRVKTKVASTSLTAAAVHSRAPKSAGTSTGGLRQTRLTDSLKGGASRRDLRSKLAGFARTGSQVQQPSSDAEEEAGNEDNHDEVATRQMRHEEPVDCDDEGPERRPGGQGKSQIIVDENLPLFLLEDENEDHDPKSNDMDLDLEATSSSVASANTSSVIGPPSTIATSALPSSSDIVNLVDDDDDDQGHTSSLLSTSERERQLSESRASQPVDRPEVIRTASSQTSYGDVHLRFNLTGIARRWSALRERLRIARERSAQIQDVMADQRQTLDSDGGVGEDATFSDSAQEAEAKLARVIDKKDFGKMDVIGQFNLGFIIVRKKVHGDAAIESDNGTHSEEDASQDVLDDLFIVDQHAADEKYNFETLQQTTNIQSQKLFRPQALELTASDELVAIENLDVLKKNGFELEVPEDPDVEMLDDETSGTQVHRRLKLVAQPVSKSTMFDMKDLEELIHLLQDRPTGQMVRCSKARAMFASRACRKSVMVGMPLTKGQMTTVVQHMGTMDQPWNCPHGRPTMRHLFDMSNINSDTKPSPRVRKKVNWSTFA